MGRIRLAFLLSSFIVLLGPLVYLALLLIVPSEGGSAQAPGLRAVVLGAQTVAGALALVALVGLSGVLAVFGLGLPVAVTAALVLGVAAVRHRSRTRAWVLLPLAALTVPATVVALLGISLDPSLRTVDVAPAALRQGRPLEVRGDLGAVHVDLRKTVLPRRGRVSLVVAAGTGHTVVALPHDRCVRVIVERRAPSSGWARLGAGLAHAPSTLFADTSRGYGVRSYGARRAPLTLHIRFSSYDARVTVRDYPDDVDPWGRPDWPGSFSGGAAPPQRTQYPPVSERTYEEQMRAYRARLPLERAQLAAFLDQLDGPCVGRVAGPQDLRG